MLFVSSLHSNPSVYICNSDVDFEIEFAISAFGHFRLCFFSIISFVVNYTFFTSHFPVLSGSSFCNYILPL